MSVIKKANNNKWNNHNPRSTETDERYRKGVPAEVYAKYERAEAAHKNGLGKEPRLQNAPFFVGAVLAGNYAGLNSSTLNLITGAYLGLRVLYNVLYINTTTQKASYLRTFTWLSSTILLIGTYIKAGNILSTK
ncbi:hypothetical protein N0V83_003036 [Neocucurbitaria cava]|uniref:Uncharacterized protein n=1 Tax=Neocucurbitaria cava TaxID=798079 RepID=A0A9W9CPD1_9PLEO|nr:hypothetical protein N0V83_003036 [Neocucurbitaria cava]